MAVSEAGLENTDAALDAEAFLLGEFARTEIVKQEQVGSYLLSENERAQLAEAQTASQLSGGQGRRALDLLHVNPG